MLYLTVCALTVSASKIREHVEVAGSFLAEGIGFYGALLLDWSVASMCVQSQYCAYQHFSSMLGRSDTDWLLTMFEVYFDDSGTDLQSPVAIAACYIST